MKGAKTIVLLIFLSCTIAAWAQPTLNELLSTANATEVQKENAAARVQSFLETIHTERSASQRTLQRMFHRVHANFLKKYEAYSDFDELFTAGKFDCLTATALFSHLLTEMKYDFDVIETNYHIFILVKTAEGEVMLETTDRLAGFVTDPEKIAKRTGDYRNNLLPFPNGDQNLYKYSFSLFQEVPTEKLSGLLVYNQAIKAYNRGAWLECALSLEKAHALYATARCEELGDILLRTIMEREVPEQVKRDCLAHLKPVFLAKAGTLAAN